MAETIDVTEHQRAVADARREGAEMATRRAARLGAGIVATTLVLLFMTVAVGWTLAMRAQAAVPQVVAELAAERQAEMEARLAARSHEARELVGQTFGFLHEVWEQNETLRKVRADVAAATTQMRLLTGEVNAAFDSPTDHLGTLLENGPTRAHAVLDHAIAVGAELQRLVPRVLGALDDARRAADTDDDDTPVLPTILSAMDALLEPFIGTNTALATQWTSLKQEIVSWMGRVTDDFEQARRDVAGDELSVEFMRRLRARIL